MESYTVNTIRQRTFLNTWKFTSTGKNLRLLGDFNLCVQKNETCNYSRDFLLALQSCYLPPNIDKPTRVYKNSASLIDNIFVNNPAQVLISGNLITRDKIKWKQIKKRNLSHFNSNSLNSDLARIDWYPSNWRLLCWCTLRTESPSIFLDKSKETLLAG